MHIPGNGRRSIGRRMTALAGRWPIAAALLLVGMAVLLAPPAQSQAQTEVWSASITTGSSDDSTIVGVWPDRSPPVGSITDRDFEYDGTTYTFTVIQVNSSGSLKIAMTAGFSQAAVDSLTFEAGNSSFALSDGTLSNSNSAVSWDSPGSSWSSGQTIAVKMVAQGATASADVTLREGGDGLPVGGDRMILEAFYDANGRGQLGQQRTMEDEMRSAGSASKPTRRAKSNSWNLTVTISTATFRPILGNCSNSGALNSDLIGLRARFRPSWGICGDSSISTCTGTI